MLKKLTPEQEILFAKHRDEVFAKATSTAPADRPTAEAAARRLAELGGVKVQDVVWVLDPMQGNQEYKQGWALLQGPLWVSLKGSLQDSLLDSLRGSLEDSLWTSLEGSLWNSLWKSLQGSLEDSLWDSLWSSLQASLWSFLWDSLWKSLQGSMEGSLWASLWNSLHVSLWNSLRDAGRTTFYRFCGELVGYSPECQEKLQLYQQLLDSCFACWVLPGKIILCERPAAVDVQDGKLIGVTWRTA
jgi:hypothetical protein